MSSLPVPCGDLEPQFPESGVSQVSGGSPGEAPSRTLAWVGLCPLQRRGPLGSVRKTRGRAQFHSCLVLPPLVRSSPGRTELSQGLPGKGVHLQSWKSPVAAALPVGCLSPVPGVSGPAAPFGVLSRRQARSAPRRPRLGPLLRPEQTGGPLSLRSQDLENLLYVSSEAAWIWLRPPHSAPDCDPLRPASVLKR